VDFDQYLLAPRESSRRGAVTAVGKAGRLVGSRREGRGEVVVQTRRGDDAVVRALESGDFDALIDEDVATAKLLGLAPYGAFATVTGESAALFVTLLANAAVSVQQIGDGYEVRAPDVDTLVAALRAVARPAGKLQVAVE